MSEQVNRLTRIQTRKVEDAILSLKADIETNPREYNESASIISRIVGFPVTDTNFTTSCKVLGVKPKPSGRSPFTGMKLAMEEARAAMLEINQMKERMIRIERKLGLPTQ